MDASSRMRRRRVHSSRARGQRVDHAKITWLFLPCMRDPLRSSDAIFREQNFTSPAPRFSLRRVNGTHNARSLTTRQLPCLPTEAGWLTWRERVRLSRTWGRRVDHAKDLSLLPRRIRYMPSSANNVSESSTDILPISRQSHVEPHRDTY